MRVLLLTRYGPLAASTRYRSMQYLPYLRERGFEIDVHALVDDSQLRAQYATGRARPWALARSLAARAGRLLASRSHDLVWLEKEVLPGLPQGLERQLLRRTPYLVDYDDAIFHRYDENDRRLIRLVLGTKIDAVMAGASTVVVGNDYLGQRARDAGARRIESLPTVIDLRRYPIPPPPPADPGCFVVGWIGSPSTAAMLEPMLEALRGADLDRPWRLVTVGAGSWRPRVPGIEHEAREWSGDTEVAEIQSFDVGVMPLRDDPWSRGKCGFKLIQYMGCARSVVASPVGVNREIVRHGENGFLVEGPDEWATHLRRLANDPELNQRAGLAGRALVEAEYCLERTAPRLEGYLRAAAVPAR